MEGDNRNTQEKKLDKIIDFLHTRPSDRPMSVNHDSKMADNELLRAAVEDLRRRLLHMCPNHEQVFLQREIDMLKRALLDTDQCMFCLANLDKFIPYEHSTYVHKPVPRNTGICDGDVDGIPVKGQGHNGGCNENLDVGFSPEDNSSDEGVQREKLEDDAGNVDDRRKNVFVKRFHICEICKKVFKRRSSLDRHRLVSHSDSKAITCTICNKQFQEQKYLKKHMRRTHEAKVSCVCSTCGKVCSSHEELNRHKRSHAKEAQMCHVCNKTLSSARKLAAHLAIHSDERPHVCDICGKGFKQKKTLRKHRFIHKDKEKCEFCEKVLAHNSMRSHVEAFHADETWFSCDSCPRKFRMKQHLVSHQQMHCAGEKCSCAECGREFASKFALSMHMHSHREVNTFKCSVCYQEFSSKDEIDEHYATHSDSERKFECETCGKTFSKKQYLIRHRLIHSDVRYPCEVCGKAFTSLWNVREHQKLHNESKPFTCDDCGKGFISQRYLELHQLSHSDVRPHQCETCGKSFARLGHLNQHMKIHSGVRPYKCELCDKTFLDSHGLRKHLNAHMKPYYCEFCSQRHASQYKLNLHMKMKHAAELSNNGSSDTTRGHLNALQQMSLQDLKQNVAAFMKTHYPDGKPGDYTVDSNDEEDMDLSRDIKEDSGCNIGDDVAACSVQPTGGVTAASFSGQNTFEPNSQSSLKLGSASAGVGQMNKGAADGNFYMTRSDFGSDVGGLNLEHNLTKDMTQGDVPITMGVSDDSESLDAQSLVSLEQNLHTLNMLQSLNK